MQSIVIYLIRFGYRPVRKQLSLMSYKDWWLVSGKLIIAISSISSPHLLISSHLIYSSLLISSTNLIFSSQNQTHLTPFSLLNSI